MLDISSLAALQAHPKCGASWESFEIEHIPSRCEDVQGYFWATHSGAELDLMLVRGERRIGFNEMAAEWIAKMRPA